MKHNQELFQNNVTVAAKDGHRVCRPSTAHCGEVLQFCVAVVPEIDAARSSRDRDIAAAVVLAGFHRREEDRATS
jgi:hypothetical protein